MDNHVFAGSKRVGRGESAKRGWDLKGVVQYFSFKGNERYSEFIKSTGQLGLQPDYFRLSSFHFRGGWYSQTLHYAVHYASHYSARFSLRGRAGAESRATYERVATCNTSPNRLSYDAVRYPLRLAVPAILGARITYWLVARAFSRKGSSLALPLTKCRGFCARSYNLRAALDGFLDERRFWSFHGRNIENFSCSTSTS